MPLSAHTSVHRAPRSDASDESSLALRFLVVPLQALNLLGKHLPSGGVRLPTSPRSGPGTVSARGRSDPGEDGTLVEILPAWRELRDGLVATLGANYPTAEAADGGGAVRAAAVVRAMQGLPY